MRSSYICKKTQMKGMVHVHINILIVNYIFEPVVQVVGLTSQNTKTLRLAQHQGNGAYGVADCDHLK